MTRQDIYDWLDKQIQAHELQTVVPDGENPFYICNAGVEDEKRVHVYGIDNLCKELGESWNVKPHSLGVDKHYFIYKGYEIFGLAERNKENERQ